MYLGVEIETGIINGKLITLLVFPGEIYKSPPIQQYDLNDLESDKEFQAVSERFLGSIGEDGDIFEYLRDSDFNLTSAMKRYADSGKFTEQQKDYAYLRTMFDGADIGSTGQWIELVKDGW